jgi:hypothetical protein
VAPPFGQSNAAIGRPVLQTAIGVVLFWTIVGGVLGSSSPKFSSFAETHDNLFTVLGIVLGFFVGPFAHPRLSCFSVLAASVLNFEKRKRLGPCRQCICITFQIDRMTVHFQLPLRLNVNDYDDTEMLKVALSTLHRTFIELAAQTRHWSLSAKELRLLSSMSLRAKK